MGALSRGDILRQRGRGTRAGGAARGSRRGWAGCGGAATTSTARRGRAPRGVHDVQHACGRGRPSVAGRACVGGLRVCGGVGRGGVRRLDRRDLGGGGAPPRVGTVILVWVALAGGLGAVARFLVDGLVRTKVSASFPLGTVLINVSGSFLLGLVTGLVLARAAPDALRLVVGTGFLGGYTTFNTAAFETGRLVEQRRVGLALLNGVGTLITTVCVAAAGFWLGAAATA